MACVKHDWFFNTACLQCAGVPTIQNTPEIDIPATVAVTYDSPPPAPYIEPPLPSSTELEDPLCLPPFLRRRPDGGWVYPSLHNNIVYTPLLQTTVTFVELVAPHIALEQRDLRKWSDEQLATLAYSDQISLEERQPIYHEMRRRADLQKTYAGLEKAGLLKKKLDVSDL